MIYQSLWPTRQISTPYADCAADVIVQRFDFTLPNTPLVAGDIIEIGVLPAFHSPCDAILLSDDLDSNAVPTLKFDVGIMSGAVGDNKSARTCGNELFAGSNIAQTGGIERASKISAFLIPQVDAHRSIGLKVTAPPATQVNGGVVRLQLAYRPVR